MTVVISFRVVVLAAVWFLAAVSILASAEDRFRGRPLEDVLTELRAGGLQIVYSSALVHTQRVEVEPTSTVPVEILEQILRPLGLTSRASADGTRVIISLKSAPRTLRGQIASSLPDAPLEGVKISFVSLERSALSDARGHYEISDIPRGRHTVEFTTTGFAVLRVRNVLIRDDRPTQLDVTLERIVIPPVEVVVLPPTLSVMRNEQAASRTVERQDALLVPTIGGDISRVIELLPGIAAADNSAALHVRGGDDKDVSILLDGLELYDPFHLKSFQSPFTVIDSSIVDAIHFVGGSYTAERGDRHGGFIDIDTLQPETEFHGGIELGTLNSRASFSGPLSAESGSWLLSTRAWYPEALRDTIELGGGERVDPRFYDAYGKATFVISPRTIYSVHGLVSYDRVSFAENDLEEPDGNESADAITRNFYGWIRLQNRLSESWSSESILSSGNIERLRSGVSAPQDDVFDVVDNREVTFVGFKHDSTWRPNERHALHGGIDLRQLAADYEYRSELTEGGEVNSIDLSPDGTSFAAFMAHRMRFSKRLAAEYGVRWNRQSYTDDSFLNPRFNLLWQPTDAAQVRFAAGRVTQSQRIHELNVEDGETAFRGAEKSTQVELVYEQRLPAGLRLRIDGYHRKLTDLRPRYENLFAPIELFPETGDDRIEIAPGSATLQGVEAMLRGDPSRPFTWWISYALSVAEDRIDGVDIPRSWDQTHAAKILLGYRHDDRWWISMVGSIHSGWPTTPVTGENVMQGDGSFEIEPVLGARNSQRYSRFVRIDAKARRTFELSRGKLSLTAEVVNLLDRENVCCVDEFEFEAQLGGEIETTRIFDHWLGITPSFSILWEY